MTMLAGGVQPERVAEEALAELRAVRQQEVAAWHGERTEAWRSYRAIMDECRRMLYPAENVTANVWLSGPEVKTVVEAAKAKRSVFISDWPRTAATALYLTLMRSSPAVRVVTTGTGRLSQAEEDKAELFEFANHGVLNILDQNNRNALEGWDSWLQQAVASITFFAKVAAMVRVSETYPGSGVATIDAPIIDPYSLMHDMGRTKVKRYIHEKFYSKRQVTEMLAGVSAKWGTDTYLPDLSKRADDDLISVGDMWLGEPDGKGSMTTWEMPLVDGQLVTDPRKTELKRPPFVVSAVRLDPMDYTGTGGDTKKDAKSSVRDGVAHHAIPFYYAKRDVVHELEGLLALVMDGAAMDAAPPVEEAVAQGAPAEEGGQEIGAAKRVVYTTGTREFKFMERRGNPVNVDKALEEAKKVLNGVVPEGLISFVLNPGESGIAAEREIEQWMKAIIPYSNAGASFAEQVLSMGWEQWLDNGNLQYKVEGKWTSGERAGKLVQVDFAPKDFPRQWRIRIELGPNLPTDKNKAEQMAILAVEQGLMTREEAMTYYMHLENVRETVRRADAGIRARDPRNQELRLLEDWDRELAAEEAKLARLTPGAREYASQQVTVDVMLERVNTLKASMLGRQPPRQLPAPPRPSPEIQQPEAQGIASPDERLTGVPVPGSVRPGVMPNPAEMR